jgi:hypothetical protein
MNPTYQLVLFNIDKPGHKFMKAGLLMYDSIKNGWTKEMKLLNQVYRIEKVRSFNVESEEFGCTYYLVIDLKII